MRGQGMQERTRTEVRARTCAAWTQGRCLVCVKRTRDIHKEDTGCPQGMREHTQDRVGRECGRHKGDRESQARRGRGCRDMEGAQT